MNKSIKMRIGLLILVLIITPMSASAMTFNVDGVDINVNEWDIDIDWKNTDVIIDVSTTITNTLYRDATIEYSGEKVLVLARSTCDTLTIVTIDMFGRNTDIKWERTSPIEMLDSTEHAGEQEITVSQTDTQQQFRKTWYPEPSEEVYTENGKSAIPEPTPVPTYIPLRDPSSTPDIDSIEGIMYSDMTMDLHVRCSLKVDKSECYLEDVTMQISGSNVNKDRIFNYQCSSYITDVIRDDDNSISEFGILNRGDLVKIQISEIPSSIRRCERISLYMLIDGHRTTSVKIALPDGFIQYDEFFDIYPETFKEIYTEGPGAKIISTAPPK